MGGEWGWGWVEVGEDGDEVLNRAGLLRRCEGFGLRWRGGLGKNSIEEERGEELGCCCWPSP